MYWFFIPLVFGFIFNWASSFTGEYSKRWGEKTGRGISFFLRMILGLPVWAAGFGLAFRQPAPLIVQLPAGLEIIAWVMILLGSALMMWALGFIGLRALLTGVRDTLATAGPYRFIRHPIYAGVFLDFAAFILLQPALPVILASTLGFIYVLAQTRLEEWDLLRRIPSYRSYMEEVPRFLPRMKGG
jgi:protein-S-isoprenylcysteine O-methyltransferase Ste14